MNIKSTIITLFILLATFSLSAQTVQVGSWADGELPTKFEEKSWDFSQYISSVITKPGIYNLVFTFKSGAHKLCLKDAVITADGKTVCSSPAERSAGASPKTIIYTFELNSVPKKLTLTAKAKSSGGTKSNGKIELAVSNLVRGPLVIPEGTTKIDKGQYKDNDVLTDVTFPSTLTEIGSSAFNNNSALKKVVIPGNVKVIGNDAFALCKNLEEVIIEEGVEVIGNNAFYDCPKLISVTIPKSVKSIKYDGLFFNNKNKRIIHCYIGSETFNLAKKYGYKIDIIGVDEEHKDTIDLKYLAVSGNKTVKAGLLRDFPIEKIELNNDIVEIGKDAFNDKSIIRVKMNTGGDKYLRENGWYLCEVLADLNTYTKDKSKQIKEDFTRILCDDTPHVEWTSYKFNTQHPLKLEEVDDKLVLTSFMLYPCKNVTVTDKNGKVLIKNKTIYPLTRTVLCDFDFLTDKPEDWTLTADDEFYKRLVSIPVNWNISFNGHVRRFPTTSLFSTLTPLYARQWIANIYDMAYVLGLPEYDKRCYEAVEKKTLVTDRELTKFLTKEQMEKLIKQARNWSLCLGMDIVGGIGGGYTLTLVSDFLLGLATSKDWTVTHSFWHEFSHCMNWGHHQGNMCNLELPAPWGQQCWPTIASKLYVEELKKGNPPYIEDRKKFFNADLFSKEFFDPRKPENDEIKKETLYIGERMPYSGSYKDHNGFSKVVFPPSVEVISGSAFYGTKLKDITIPSTVKKIDGLAFHSSYLTKIEIPNNVKSVGNAAFQNCKDLTSVKIGKGVRQLNYRLFKDSGLKEITIPANVQYIGDESFQGCKNLKKVVIENGVRKIGSNAFNGTGLKEIKIPASVTMFGKYITSKNVVWDVEEGSSAYQFALENKYRIKQNGEAADDDKILKENAARILAESSTAEAAPTNGWQKGTFKSKDVRRKWDFSDILEYNQVGEYVITFSYQGGACKLCLSDVLFVADDKPISFFPEMCSAGASPREIVYEIEVPTETKKLEMYALAKTSGGNDSRGTVIISMPDDGTTESKIARIMAEGETADDASSDNWNGGTFAKSETRRKWNFSEYIKGTKGGKHIVTFRYEKGDNILCLRDALFMANGEPLAYFPRLERTGASIRQIVYEIDIPVGTNSLELLALVGKTGGAAFSGTIKIESLTDKTKNVLAEAKNAEVAPSDGWENKVFSNELVRRRWDFSSSLNGEGEYTVNITYIGGDDSFLLYDVLFTADGKMLLYSPDTLNFSVMGANVKFIEYKLNVPAGTKKLEMFGIVKGKASKGKINVVKEE